MSSNKNLTKHLDTTWFFLLAKDFSVQPCFDYHNYSTGLNNRAQCWQVVPMRLINNSRSLLQVPSLISKQCLVSALLFKPVLNLKKIKI